MQQNNYNTHPLYKRIRIKKPDTEDNPEKAAHKLRVNQIITEYGLTISVQKTKLKAFKGRDPVRTNIVIDNKIIEQVNLFNYLGNIISYKTQPLREMSKGKGKAIPLQAWTGPQGSRRLRLPDFKTIGT